MKRTTCLIGALAAATAVASGSNQELNIVRDGKPDAEIVLPDRPTLAAQWGARELQWHLLKITGAELPVLPESQATNGAAVKLFVGATARARASGLTPPLFQPGEHAYQILSNAVVFAGIDKEDYRTLTYDPDTLALTPFPDQFDARGSVDAVYDFLERQAGVRWLAATRTGTVIPTQTTFKVAIGIRRFTPSFAMRQLWDDPATCMWPNDSTNTAAYRELCWPGAGKNGALANRLAALFRLRRHAGGEQPMGANHSLYGYYQRFSEAEWKERLAKAPTEKDRNEIQGAKARVFEGDRPEFFAQGYPAQPPQLCYSSTALIAQVARDARDYYDGKANSSNWPAFGWKLPNPFPIEPMDNSSFCRCTNCAAWFTPERGAGEYSSGAHSDYIFHFVESVAEELHKTHPGQEVICAAYMTHSLPPTRFSLDPKVHVQLTWPCNRSAFMTPSYQKELDNLRAWSQAARGSGRKLSVWLYNTFPREQAVNGNINCFPGFFAHQFARELRELQALGYRGIFNCGWGQEVENHVGLALMYDSSANDEQLIGEYFTGLYGAAAAPMRQLYLEMEAVYADPKNRPEKRVGLAELSWKWLGTSERMRRWQGLLDHARAMAVNERERTNLEIFQQAIWSYMLTGADKYAARMSAPIPAVMVPRIPDAGADPRKVDWTRAAELRDAKLPAHWYNRGGDNPSARKFSGRIAHDGKYLYLELTDPCATARLYVSGMVFCYDDWEIFFARQRGLPYRQYALGPTGLTVALSHGEVNWRMNVPVDDKGGMQVVSDTRAPDKWVSCAMFPLDKIVPEGLKPGEKIYMNIVRVSSPAISGKSPYGADTWVSFSTVHEMDRLAEITLSK